MPKSSPYKKILSRKLLKLIEAGTLDLILSRWERGGILNCGASAVDTSPVESLGYGKCKQAEDTSRYQLPSLPESLTTLALSEKLVSLFILLVFGYTLAVVMFSSEVFFHGFENTKPRIQASFKKDQASFN